MRYFNWRRKKVFPDVSLARLDSEVKALYKQLDWVIVFLAYRYHILVWFIILPPTVEIFLTKIAGDVTQMNYWIRNIGNGMIFTSEHHRDLRQGLIRIPKSEMKEFEIRNWKIFVFGDFLTIKQANIATG